MADYTFQKQIARALLSAGEDVDVQQQPAVAAMAIPVMAAPKPPIPFPAGLAPKPPPSVQHLLPLTRYPKPMWS
jgi:hypothetical protein